MALARLLLVLLALLAAPWGWGASPPPPPAPAARPLTVHFFDVGQGDAALIISPTGKTVLIDGGPPEAGPELARRLRELTPGPLDLVLLSHPHLDHLGGLSHVLRAVGARRFMDPGFDHPSEAYRDLLELVGQKVGQVQLPTPNPKAPDAPLTIGLGEGATLTVLWPRVPQEPFLTGTRSDANSNSIVARLTYGKTAVLFSGDAEPSTEAHLLQKPIDFTSTVLKVAHHGGRHSSTAHFLEAVRPQAAVISCGAGNEYGHPSKDVLRRLEAVGAHVLRTDLHGEVRAVSNGDTFTLTARRGRSPPVVLPGRVGSGPVRTGPLSPTARPSGAAAPETTARSPRASEPRSSSSSEVRYVSLRGSEVFHREDCSTLQRAKEKERTHYPSREEAARERRPAKDCHP